MQAKRIIINTISGYGSSVISLLLALFSTRWILQSLGHVDFGLYGIVGSLILLTSFMSDTLANGVSRFYALAIGEGSLRSNQESSADLKQWFNTALSLHMVLPVILIGIGWPVGEYAITYWLDIPDPRLNTCIWVYRLSLVGTFFTIVAIPFVAMYTAQQRIFELAAFAMLRNFAIFIAAWSLLKVTADQLIFYAICMLAINTATSLLQILRAIHCFEVCRIQLAYMYKFVFMKKLMQYVGWKCFAMTCYTLRTQGTPLLANLHFGPIVNAAYSIAFSVSGHATALSAAMTHAYQPAIISAEGTGNRSNMLSMALQSCKFGSLLALLFVIPLSLEMNAILNLWLINPPEYAATLCQWMLAMLVLDRMTKGHMFAVNAQGKIAVYDLVQGSLLFLALPLMWLCFHFGQNPIAIGPALFITLLLYCLGRVLFAKILLNFSILPWCKQVVFPGMLLISLSSIAGYCWKLNQDEGFLSILGTSVICSLIICVSSWYFLLSQTERHHTTQLIGSFFSKY